MSFIYNRNPFPVEVSEGRRHNPINLNEAAHPETYFPIVPQLLSLSRALAASLSIRLQTTYDPISGSSHLNFI